MSQAYFSKQDPTEKLSRLSLLGSSRGSVTIWLKGHKEKHSYKVFKFDRDRMEIVLDTKENLFSSGQTLLCTFELRGMTFFSEVTYQISISGFIVLLFESTLFKSERRASFRLLTYPLHEVVAEFDLGEAYQGGKVVDLKTRVGQTGLFKNFLQLVNAKEAPDTHLLKIRIQDLSTTGMSLHVGDLECEFFSKGLVYHQITIRFKDEVIVIPEIKVVYVVDYISSDKNMKKYKVGLHFENLPVNLDDQIGKKINSLLRENDFNKDFENFVK